jgi:hypothetical protein
MLEAVGAEDRGSSLRRASAPSLRTNRIRPQAAGRLCAGDAPGRASRRASRFSARQTQNAMNNKSSPQRQRSPVSRSSSPQARGRTDESLDYVFVKLSDDYGITFVGKRRDLNSDTVELCAPDGRPVFRVPRRIVTSITREKAAELLHQKSGINAVCQAVLPRSHDPWTEDVQPSLAGSSPCRMNP